VSAPPKHTALYRYLDPEGGPLYIGITSHLKDRKTAHAHSRWAKEAASFTVEWYPSDAEAAAAETLAIRAERPRYNLAENFDRISLDGMRWPSLANAGRTKAVRLAELIRAEIDSGRWPAKHKLPAPRDLAAAVEIGVGATTHAIELLIRQQYVYRYRAFGHFVRTRSTL
jgi:predicted GIY-YIG superfamily endonuclease